MKNLILVTLILLVLVCSAVQASGERLRAYPLRGAERVESSSGLSPKNKRMIEVEPQPWGVGIAAFFTIFGVLVMKVRTPRPAFFTSSKR